MVGLAPWLGLVFLNALFVLPTVALRIPEQPWLLLMPSGELVLLVATCVGLERWGRQRWIRGLLLVLGLIVWIYKIDAVVGTTILTRTPLLYDQIFLLRHLNILIGDLWDWTIGTTVIGIIVASAAVLTLCRWLILVLARSIARLPNRLLAAIAVVTGILLVVGTYAETKRKKWVDWTVPDLVQNLRESREMYLALQQGIGESPYAGFNDAVRLTRKPHVQLFLVESYGRVLSVDPRASESWKSTLEGADVELRAKGWHTVSGFSVAPVSGGRSWLAEATLLTGIRIRFEAVYRHLIEEIDSTPNLVSFLRAQGYETILLAPKDRARRGLEIVNYWGYSTSLHHDELEYTGPSIGWGEIPDQYTLGFADENVFAKTEGPYFSNFHMVSSHAPWRAIPRVLGDWKKHNRSKPPLSAIPNDGVEVDEEEENLDEVFLRVQRYRRVEPNFKYMGQIDALKMSSYWRSIDYDLEIIKRYLLEQEGDRIVIIMGDHQPPLISTEDASYDVPIHILSKDPALLAEFEAVGFTPGLYIQPNAYPAIAHESFFSLIVRNLARCCAEPGTEPPAVRFEGVSVGS